MSGPVVAVDATAIHPESGGAGRYVRELVAHLPGAGVEAVVLARRGDTGGWPGAARILRVAPDRRPLRLIWEQTRLLSTLGDRAPLAEVLHSPHYTMPERRPGPRPARVVTVHDATFFTRPQDHQRAKVLLFRRAARIALERADAVIVPTRSAADALGEHLRVRAPVHVVHHGIDRLRFRPSPPADGPSDADVLERLGVREPFVLHLGAIEPRKNVDVLCEAMERLASARHPAEGLSLVLAGRPWRGGLGALPPSRTVPRHLLGFVADADATALLRRAAVVAYPSSEEGFGFPVLEALACGATVVTTDRGATAEVAAGAALLVAPRDPDALADALERALRNGRAGLADPVIPTWSACAAAHAAVYRAALGAT